MGNKRELDENNVGWAVFFAHLLQGNWWAEKIAHPTGLDAVIRKNLEVLGYGE